MAWDLHASLSKDILFSVGLPCSWNQSVVRKLWVWSCITVLLQLSPSIWGWNCSCTWLYRIHVEMRFLLAYIGSDKYNSQLWQAPLWSRKLVFKSFQHPAPCPCPPSFFFISLSLSCYFYFGLISIEGSSFRCSRVKHDTLTCPVFREISNRGIWNYYFCLFIFKFAFLPIVFENVN